MAGESITITGTGTVASAIAGAGKTITLGTLTLADGTASASNYSLASGTFDIISRQVNISGSRIYDGTTAVNGTDLVVTTGVGSEILTVSGAGSISNANVGTDKSVTAGTLALASGSGTSSNYTIGSITLTVTQRPLNTNFEKTYDASVNATSSDLKTNGITNTVLSHSLTLNGTGTMSTTSVGIGKSLSVGTLTLSGAQSANYTLTGGTHTIDVNPRTTNATGARHYDGSTVARGSAFNSFSNTVGSDTVTLSGSGTIASADVGSKGVTIGTLQSAHPNYTLGNATLTVTQKPVNLFGSRVAGEPGGRDIQVTELSFTNLAAGETLNLSGVGRIPSIAISTHPLSLHTLTMSNGTGLTSNYTFVGGSLLFKITSPLRSRAGVLKALKTMSNGNNRKLLPSKTSHRSMPAISERITVSTPDRSVEVNPCILQNGYCN